MQYKGGVDMATRSTFLTTPTLEIDLDRYEELIKHELMYEQYRQQADEKLRNLIETNIETKLIESEEK